jgi:serine/threonine protein kinase
MAPLSDPHRYDLDPEPVARGSQGTIHLATRSDGTRVAVKIATPASTEALRHEVRMLRAMAEARVGGVVDCLDAIDLDGRPALVMPVYPRHLGDWISEIVQQAGPTTLDDVLAMGEQLARTLAGMHRVALDGGRLVHRDVKPENVFIDDRGHLHLGDFGCAVAVDGLRAVELALYGTPMWAPLDQVLPGHTMPDPTWDTYALCVILYAALTGTRPAYQADPRELLTHRGRQLWELARRAIASVGPERGQLQQAFGYERMGATAADLIDVTGRAALLDTDRAVLHGSLDRLCAAAAIDPAYRPLLLRGLWSLLVRGLSPVSHPSPPNRYPPL